MSGIMSRMSIWGVGGEGEGGSVRYYVLDVHMVSPGLGEFEQNVNIIS